MISKPGRQYLDVIRGGKALIYAVDSEASLGMEVGAVFDQFAAAFVELYPEGKLHRGVCSPIRVKDLPDVGIVSVCHARFNSEEADYAIEVGAYRTVVSRSHPFRGEPGLGLKFTVNPVN